MASPVQAVKVTWAKGEATALMTKVAMSWSRNWTK